MALPAPFYQDALITLYNADCRDILPQLPPGFTWAILDPPERDGLPDVLAALMAQVTPLLQAICTNILQMTHMVSNFGTGPNRNRLVSSSCSFTLNGTQQAVATIPDPDMKITGWANVVSARVAVGNTVIDPFAGAGGWILLAAKRAGVQAVGIELNADYCAQSAARLAVG